MGKCKLTDWTSNLAFEGLYTKFNIGKSGVSSRRPGPLHNEGHKLLSERTIEFPVPSVEGDILYIRFRTRLGEICHWLLIFVQYMATASFEPNNNIFLKPCHIRK